MAFLSIRKSCGTTMGASQSQAHHSSFPPLFTIAFTSRQMKSENVKTDETGVVSSIPGMQSTHLMYPPPPLVSIHSAVTNTVFVSPCDFIMASKHKSSETKEALGCETLGTLENTVCRGLRMPRFSNDTWGTWDVST